VLVCIRKGEREEERGGVKKKAVAELKRGNNRNEIGAK
jgi:hypothetical protein